MNIQSNYVTPNFQARIKLRSPNLKTLAQASVGAASLGAGAIMATDTGVSVVAQGHNSAYDSAANLGQTPKEILE